MTPQILVFNDNDESIIFLKCLVLKFVIIFKKYYIYILKKSSMTYVGICQKNGSFFDNLYNMKESISFHHNIKENNLKKIGID